eukprot:TRINITY_DN2251_c0_g1_i1.p1 TRINITY_DN2251_c0_g1~~TRINITY_DN2251_c0_g1_i1.p1  ORF type:complete len:547 (+),score=92.46 TRINITY_DN2251_c0_g1_i1:704-2344(+)
MEHEGDTKFDVLVRNAFRERSDSLDVSGMNLEGWPELRSGSISQKLPNLKSFIADHNSFSIQLDELQSFELLEVVSLMGCGLTQFPASICTLKYLTELRLNGNNISEIPSGIRNLQRLSEFYIHNNQIYDLPPEIGYLQRMEVCNLSGNNIQFLPSDIGDCRYLSVLDISFCKLEELPPEFTNLYRLVELNISNNQIRELPEDIGKFHRLSNFNISSNRINILPISCGLLRGLSSTACTFNISGNPILNQEVLEKWGIGCDHLIRYLETIMISKSGLRGIKYDLPPPVRRSGLLTKDELDNVPQSTIQLKAKNRGKTKGKSILPISPRKESVSNSVDNSAVKKPRTTGQAPPPINDRIGKTQSAPRISKKSSREIPIMRSISNSGRPVPRRVGSARSHSQKSNSVGITTLPVHQDVSSPRTNELNNKLALLRASVSNSISETIIPSVMILIGNIRRCSTPQQIVPHVQKVQSISTVLDEVKPMITTRQRSNSAIGTGLERARIMLLSALEFTLLALKELNDWTTQEQTQENIMVVAHAVKNLKEII